MEHTNRTIRPLTQQDLGWPYLEHRPQRLPGL